MMSQFKGEVWWSYPGQDEFGHAQGFFIKTKLLPTDFPSFVVAPFQLSDGFLSLKLDQVRSKPADQIRGNLSAYALENKGESTIDGYHQLVQKGLKRIQAKALEKVVLSATSHLKADLAGSVFDLAKKARNRYPNAFIALFGIENYGLWIMASPELFLKRNDDHLSSFALAGTRSINDSQIPFGEKEIFEQSIVTSEIKQVYQSFGIKTQINELQTQKAGHLNHLLNYITGTAIPQNFNLHKFIEELHPTAAVGGKPKTEALAFIHENEGYRRKFYTGFAGKMASENEFEFYVTLRAAQIYKDSICFYAGAGIVAGSNPVLEEREIRSKADVLRNLL